MLVCGNVKGAGGNMTTGSDHLSWRNEKEVDCVYDIAVAYSCV